MCWLISLHLLKTKVSASSGGKVRCRVISFKQYSQEILFVLKNLLQGFLIILRSVHSFTTYSYHESVCSILQPKQPWHWHTDIWGQNMRHYYFHMQRSIAVKLRPGSVNIRNRSVAQIFDCKNIFVSPLSNPSGSAPSEFQFLSSMKNVPHDETIVSNIKSSQFAPIRVIPCGLPVILDRLLYHRV